VAFFAVVSIGVVGLYVAFAIPIFLRWRAGSSFQALSSNWAGTVLLIPPMAE